jgi:hypothetical protein
MLYEAPYGQSNPNASYVDGNPAAGIQGSIIPAAAVEAPQREIVEVITQANIVPSDTDLTQLAQGIEILARYWIGTFAGTANALTCTLPAVVKALTPGMVICGVVSALNISSAILTPVGLPSAAITQADGTAYTGGELTPGLVVAFRFDGTAWRMLSQLPNSFLRTKYVPILPISTYYVDEAIGSTLYDGTSEAISGTHGPWPTLAYAVAQLTPFASAGVTINVRGAFVAPTGVNFATFPASAISQWTINGSGPGGVGMCTVDATATGAAGIVAQGSTVTVGGFSIKAYSDCFASHIGAQLTLMANNITGSTAGNGVVAYEGAVLSVFGSMSVSGTYGVSIFNSAGYLGLGFHDVNVQYYPVIAFATGATTAPFIIAVESAGFASLDFGYLTFTGIVTATYAWVTDSAGGIAFNGGGKSYLEAHSTNPGIAITATYGWYTP